MTLFESLSLAIAAGQMLVGAVAVGSVWLGILQMRRAGDQREKREDARHREAMEVIRRQDETLRQQGEALRQQGEALLVLVKGLETVIERTAPKEQRPASPERKTP